MSKFVDVTIVLAGLRETLQKWLGASRTHQRVRQAGSLCRKAVTSAMAEPEWLGRRRRRRTRRRRAAYAAL